MDKARLFYVGLVIILFIREDKVELLELLGSQIPSCSMTEGTVKQMGVRNARQEIPLIKKERGLGD